MKTYILNPMLSRKEYSDSITDKFNAVGGNTGNLIFYEAAKEHLNFEGEITVFTNPSEFDMNNAVVVIPSSNFLMHGGDDQFFQQFIDFLDRTTCPVTLIGLGAQSSPIFNTPSKLVRGVQLNRIKVEFFKKLSERTTTIGVRGAFTGECLELLGITNYKIIGCPSFYKWTDGIFPTMPCPSLDLVQMTTTPSKKRPYKTKVLDFGISNDCYWMMQSLSEKPRIIKVCGKDLVDPKWRIRRFAFEKHSTKCIEDYITKRSVVCFTIDEWNRFYQEKRITFSFGTRFHGNMAAFRNRVPSLWITHDSRTKELTEFLGLPNIPISDFQGMTSLEELISYCNYSEMGKRYSALCHIYVDFLNQNSINHFFNIEK